jgi:hypothetical protein
MLKPQPRRRERCTSAEPSSRFNGRCTKLFPPASACSQKPSRRYEGSPTGAFDEPDKFTPRNKSMRPWESTKLPSMVCMKPGGVRQPVVGETAGILGMLRCCREGRRKGKQRKKGELQCGVTISKSYHLLLLFRVRVSLFSRPATPHA